MIVHKLYAVVYCALLLFMLCPVKNLRPTVRAALLLGMGLLVAIPLGDTTLTMLIRSMTGDLSIITVYWLGCVAADRIRSGTSALPADQVRGAAIVLSGAALILYPAALGLGQWDSYRSGFGMSLPLICGLLAVLLLLLAQRFMLMALSLGLLAHACRLLESENLWDYLLDPWLAGFAVICMMRWRSSGAVESAPDRQ